MPTRTTARPIIEHADDARRVAERVAAALGWDGQGAPRILASARGADALTLMDRAREAGVPLHEDRELAALLAQIPVQTEIPPELYHVVAEVLAWIFAASGVDPRDRLHTSVCGDDDASLGLRGLPGTDTPRDA